MAHREFNSQPGKPDGAEGLISDGSPFWLLEAQWRQPHGNYRANTFFDIIGVCLVDMLILNLLLPRMTWAVSGQ